MIIIRRRKCAVCPQTRMISFPSPCFLSFFDFPAVNLHTADQICKRIYEDLIDPQIAAVETLNRLQMFDKFAGSRLRLLVDPQIAAVERLNRLQMFDKFADSRLGTYVCRFSIIRK